MTKFVKFAALAATVLAATPAFAAPVSVTGAPPVATARIIKPLTLTATGELNFGTIVIPAGGVSADQTVKLDGATGLIAAADCGNGVDTVCSGTTTVPTYTVTGTNNQTVTIRKYVSQLTNANNAAQKIDLTPTGAATLALGNSGSAGVPFTVGGNIVIKPTHGDGVYSGTVDVRVEY